MSGCDVDALEALAFEELPPARAEEARAHVAGCAACARELGLLRAERGAFADRAKASSPLPGFSAALAKSRWSAPTTAPVKAPPPTLTARFLWAAPAFGVAAAAAFAGLFLLPPPDPTRVDRPAAPLIVAVPASENFCRDEAYYDGFTAPAKAATVCEMPEPTGAEEGCGSCRACAPAPREEIGTCAHDSPVTEACYSPLPD